MGLLGGIADTVADVAGEAAEFLPGGDVIGSGIDAVQESLGGTAEFDIGTGGGSGQPQQPSRPRKPPTLGGGPRGTGGRTGPTSMMRTTAADPPEGIRSGGMMNLPGLPAVGGGFSLTSPPSNVPQGQQQATSQPQGQQDGQMTLGGSGGFLQAFVADMLDEEVSGASRAVLEAMQAGSLQGGMIQQPVRVETPRGTEFHSRPGFRTVTLNGQKVSVFKPVAKALGLLPGGERTFREKADDAAREYLKMRRRWKDLASKFGFKSPSPRKSGPKR